MASESAADNSAKTAEPRRSGRIAARPAQPSAEVKSKATRGAKKRAAEEPTVAPEAEKSTSKKTKADSDAEEEEEEGSNTVLSPIDIGDTLPSLVLKNEKGEDIQIAELTAEHGVILFLVPKADTPGCTTQACGYRDIYPDFTSLNYVVYCLSADNPTAQSKWQTKKELPYPLISDPKRELITALGAGEGGKTKRSHFVFGKGGKLLERVMPVKPADSPRLALEFIKNQQ